MLHFLQTQLDLAAAARHVAIAGFTHTAAADEALVVKTVLTEALAGAAIRPWRVEARSRTALVVTGYGALPAEEVERRRRLALPSLQAAVGEVLGYPLPEPQAGEHVRLVVRLCPTVRVTPGRPGVRHGERDAYLHAVDLAGGTLARPREEVYADYLRERLPGVELEAVRMVGFRIARAARKAGDGVAVKAVPVADVEALARVADPEMFSAALGAGVGRQRAFGCGMVRVEPAVLVHRAA